MTIQIAMPKMDAMYCQKRAEPHSCSHVWYMAHTACSNTKPIFIGASLGLFVQGRPCTEWQESLKWMHKPTLQNMFIVSELMRARIAKIIFTCAGSN